MLARSVTITAAAVAQLLIAGSLSEALADEPGAKEDAKVGYDKGFFIHTDNFSLKLGGRFQFRFTQENLEGAGADEDAEGNFDIQRARLTLGGHFYRPTVQYYIQYDLRGESTITDTSLEINDDGDGILEVGEVSVDVTEKREPDLRDAWLDFTKVRLAQLRVGQFKVPFGTQELTSSGSQQFVDRSIASDAFTPSRDQGLMLFGHTESEKFGYMAGVFNGNGRNRSSNDNEEYRYAVRVNFDPNGEYKLSESAVEHPEKTRWTIGGAWTQSADDPAGDEDQTTLNFFFGLKYRPFSVFAEYFDQRLDLAGGEIDSDGFVLQAGLFVVPRKFEVALRYSEVDPSNDLQDDEIEETRVAAGWFWSDHHYKLQLDYGIITFNEANGTLLSQIAGGGRPGLSAGEEVDDEEFRAQLQFRF